MADRKETYSSKLVLKDVISGETIPRIVARTPTLKIIFKEVVSGSLEVTAERDLTCQAKEACFFNKN